MRYRKFVKSAHDTQNQNIRHIESYRASGAISNIKRFIKLYNLEEFELMNSSYEDDNNFSDDVDVTSLGGIIKKNHKWNS